MTPTPLLAWLALAAVSTVGCSSSVAKGGQCASEVGSTAELEQALDCAADGAEIRLVPGHYAAAKLSGIKAPVTIRSANPASPATFAEMAITRAERVTLDDIAFRGAPTTQRFQLMISRSARIAVRNVDFTGGSRGVPALTASAIMVRDSTGIEVTNSRFDGYWHAISMLNLDGVRIARNRFVNTRTDGIRGGGVSNAVIEANVLSDFYPAPKDHPDGIQLWSTHQTVAARNIAVRDNLVMRGNGSPTQGVFIRDTHRMLPFENVTISGNLVVGGLYNGITIDGVVGGEVTHNTVLPATDRQSWIRLERAVNATVTDNRAGRFVLRGDIAQDRNRIVEQRSDASRELAAWSARTGIRP